MPASTGSALSSAVPEEQIHSRQLMPPLALGFSRVNGVRCVPNQSVRTLGQWFRMSGIHARLVATFGMVQFVSFGDGTDQQFVGEAMGIAHFVGAIWLASVKLTVAALL
jgi:hypothetical protein